MCYCSAKIPENKVIGTLTDVTIPEAGQCNCLFSVRFSESLWCLQVWKCNSSGNSGGKKICLKEVTVISGQTDSCYFPMQEQMLIICTLKDQKIDYRTKRNCFFWPYILSSSTSKGLSTQWPWPELDLCCLLLASRFPQFSVATAPPLASSDLEGGLRCWSTCMAS